MIFFPNAKINIGLDVLRRRADGFHEIETVMVPVTGLCDILEIVPSAERGVVFAESGIISGCTAEENLCVRAYRLLEKRFGIGGVRMRLHKTIPFGAGLGGGSSDAASAIKGLNRLFDLGLDDTKMEELAAEIGSDTAFFIHNEPQLATGRGEILSPISLPLTGKKLVIIKPDVTVSTAEAYRGVTPRIPERDLEQRLAANPTAWRGTVENAFENHIFEAYPFLRKIKEAMYECGALYASMSGSGSAVYGIFEEGQNAPEKAVTALLGKDNGELFVYQQVMP